MRWIPIRLPIWEPLARLTRHRLDSTIELDRLRPSRLGFHREDTMILPRVQGANPTSASPLRVVTLHYLFKDRDSLITGTWPFRLVAQMKTKQGSTAELDELIRKAMEQAGVAETMRMYQKYQKAVASIQPYLRVPQPVSTVSDSSS